MGIITCGLSAFPFLAQAATPDEAVQVYPLDNNVITVTYQGHVFELNLPDEIEMARDDVEVVESAFGLIESVEATEAETQTEPQELPQAALTSEPEVVVTDDIESVVEPPSEEMLDTIEETYQAAEAEEAIEASPQPTTLRFSELYPNTTGSDADEEYIEVQNFGDETLDLNGWSITDASGKTWTADGAYELAPGEVVALARELTKIALNNNGETVELRTPDGDLVDSVVYESTTKGSTYTLSSDGWSWSNPTPNEVVEDVESADSLVENVEIVEDVELEVPEVVVEEVPEVAEATEESETQALEVVEITLTEETQDLSETELETDTSSNQTSTAYFPEMTITEARSQALDTRVSVEGFVSVLPGTFATQYFYIEDGSGVQIYMYRADFPDMEVGNRVRVQGVMSQNRGEARVKTSTQDDITVIEEEVFLGASYTSLGSVGEDQEGELVMVEGTVEAARSGEMTLVEGEDLLEIIARTRTGVTFTDMASGNRVQVTGIVSEYDGAYRVLPRSQDDVVVIEEIEEPVLAGTTGSSGIMTGLYGAFLLLAALGAMVFWFVRSRQDQDLTITNA